MSLFSLRQNPKTCADYEAFVADKPDEERWELIDGEILLQATGTDVHQRIVTNLLMSLHGAAQRKSRDCAAYPGLNIKVDHVDTYAPIPDVIVRCGPLTRSNWCSDPLVLVEVLSPSTADKDRGFKAIFCKLVPGLVDYLIVYADEPRVELWQRDGEAWQLLPFTRADEAVPLSALAAALPLTDI